MANIEIPAGELNSFDLPKVCVMTGATDSTVEFRKVKFQWHPRWVFALILVNLLIMAIVAQIMTKRVQGELAFSEAAWKRWRLWKVLAVFAALGMVFGIIGGVVLTIDEPAAGISVTVLAFALGLTGIIMGQRAGPQVVSIKDNVLTLKITNPEVSSRYQQQLRVGRAPTPLAR